MESSYEAVQRERLARLFDDLTVELEGLSPSAWAEAKRYLPPSATSLPGYYRFEVTPYLREIIDCLSPDSPIRFVSLQKGAQVGATTLLENGIGYLIDHVKTAPVMLVTADAELAKIRLDTYIIPMIQSSKLDHLIRSSDTKNSRKTGQTDKRIEWEGGGFLVPFGAVNANKLRSLPIQVLLRDEINGWPDVVGKDGDPMRLSEARTAAYESTRKVFDISTPSIRGRSKIAKRFALGDQRYYFVCCLRCGFSQTLRWRRTSDTGVVSGIVWETENDRLVVESVRYLCENCGHEHFNDDKTRLLAPENGAEWRPTAVPASPDHRSYHLSALYSPVGMQTWAACVLQWRQAWDEQHNRAKDIAELQVFYNNVLGEDFEVQGDKLTFETVSPHRRQAYRFGEIPNTFAREHCGSPVLLLVCTVDVHGDNLAVTVWGWCRERRPVLIEYRRLMGDTDRLDCDETWGELGRMFLREYVADDGRRYRIQMALVDSGYQADVVYEFCHQYPASVYPVKGREMPKGTRVELFTPFVTKLGTSAYLITVDFYKDRWHAALRRQWSGLDLQPPTHFNAPVDATDKQMRELTSEVRRVKVDARTKQQIGIEWHRPSGAPNELWDCLVYADAALDIIAWDVCVNQPPNLEAVDWLYFYDRCAEGLFFTDGPTN